MKNTKRERERVSEKSEKKERQVYGTVGGREILCSANDFSHSNLILLSLSFFVNTRAIGDTIRREPQKDKGKKRQTEREREAKKRGYRKDVDKQE